ncbi:MAG: hypothetical protein HQK53_07190 [Oligoflexia bacterium]|nr:hypothetical protein [Oligoflexia bacterium]
MKLGPSRSTNGRLKTCLLRSLLLLSLSLMSLPHFFPVSLASPDSSSHTYEVMSYNVENLFDATHDKDMEDWEFLPIDHPLKSNCGQISSPANRKRCYRTDWTDEKMELKISQIAKAILSERATAPDMLGVVEIENKNVLKRLANKLGYQKYVITEGEDERGINVALLFNLNDHIKYQGYYQHTIDGDWFEEHPTRNILEVVFKINDRYPLSVFVNHWPAPQNPHAARVEAAKMLRTKILARTKDDPNYRVVVVGDFNTVNTEYPNPVDEILIGSDSSTFLSPSSLSPALTNVHSQYINDPQCDSSQLPPGTYYYTQEKVWNDLDKILVSSNMISSDMQSKGNAPQLLPCSFDIHNPRAINNRYKNVFIPWRYNFSSENADDAGFSDHYPLLFKFTL